MEMAFSARPSSTRTLKIMQPPKSALLLSKAQEEAALTTIRTTYYGEVCK